MAWILQMGAKLAFNGLLLLEPDAAGVVSISLWALIAAQGPEAFAKCPFKETKSLPHPGHLDFGFDGIRLCGATSDG